MISKCPKSNYLPVTAATEKTTQPPKCMAGTYAKCSGVQNCHNIEAGKFS